MSKLQPVIKWSGSKRSQAEKIVSLIDKTYDTYYETFCGGCSVLYYILNNCPEKFNHYVCNDINKPLIELYKLIKKDYQYISNSYEKMWKELNSFDSLDDKRNYFVNIRTIFNQTNAPELLFFIMRTTTNGMPRYNNKGEFNNSFHITRNGINPLTMNSILKEWSQKLNEYDVQFISQSFENINPSANDFMYLDPPYFNTKGMYYGRIDYEKLWEYLRNQDCDYFLSFDGKAGKESFVIDIPTDVYYNHLLLESGNSSFRRVIGKSNDTNVYESLYVKVK